MVDIRDLYADDIDAVFAIADSQLGKNYITKTDLSEGKVFIAEEDGKILGFCIALVGAKDGKSYVRWLRLWNI